MQWIVPLLLSCAVAACGQASDDVIAEEQHCPDLQRFDPDQAATDGAKAALGSPYLMGVYGYTTEVPSQVRRDLPIRMIEGTSDSDCPELNARARLYAERFNQAVQGANKR